MRFPYVTTVGAISNLGNSWPETWRRLLAGEWSSHSFRESGIEIDLDVPTGVIPALDRELGGDYASEGAAMRLALTAAREALADWGRSAPLSIYGGSNHGETDIMLSLFRAGLEEVAISNERELWEGILFDPLAEHITRPEVPGSVLQAWTYSACASGVHALICAAMDLADACDGLTGGLVLGVDSLSAIGSAGFVRSGAATASRCNPFRKSRDGMMVSEGACAMLLRQRPAVTESSPVRILGIGMSCDGGHPTQPDPRGTHLERAIRNAIERAGLHPNDVGAIVAHGTGTTANDNVEAAVFHRIWPEADVPVTSVKGALGHTMGASGLFNCLVAVEACRTGLLPPTAGDSSQPEEGLHLVVGRGRQIEAGSPVLVDCSGFGGNNVSIIFG